MRVVVPLDRETNCATPLFFGFFSPNYSEALTSRNLALRWLSHLRPEEVRVRFVRDGSESQAAAQLLLAAAWRATTHKRQITAGK